MHFLVRFTAVCLSSSLQVLAQNYRFDVNTIKTCTVWYDNSGDHSCKDVRDSLAIKPETFTRWNPSITLDCGNWELNTSYCTWVDSEAPPLPSSTTAVTPTTPKPSAKPSPSSWKPLGCWPVGPTDFLSLEKRISDIPNNTPAKCQDACYNAANANYRFAGMVAGSQCWCSDFVRNDMSANETADCNVPCAGETSKTCGGAEFVNVYEADFSAPQTTSSIPSTVVASSSSISSTIVASPSSVKVASSASSTMRVWRMGAGVATCVMLHIIFV
ncbi:hypothetical protein HBH70_074470 [Parastagonospora nodorum]|nr:hypothetical protein HBH70_074470 [Parastagonospora nodorum]KAH5457950.1 hypothetical protein HBI30_063080 [Parastagonospora nodorum]KAH6399005.1 hypothetical protein HBI08_181550 [Parastagonospora nodorum]